MEKLSILNGVILDTETTGLGEDARIVEISGICAVSGEVLFDHWVNPLCKIPSEAYAIHGIGDSDVAHMPTFDEVWNHIKEYLFDKQVLIYNFSYDYRLIAQSLSDFGYPVENLKHMISGHCVMEWYAEFYGAINPLYGSFAWQKLVNACAQQGIDISDLRAHQALSDCEMTRRLIHAVNSKV